MAMPEQVRKQIEAADEKMKEILEEQGVDNSTNSSSEPTSSDATPSNADDADKNVQSSGANEHSAKEDPNSDTYAQRWRTLQGQYNAEVPRLRNANKEMQSRLAQLEQLLSSIQNTQPAASAADH